MSQAKKPKQADQSAKVRVYLVLRDGFDANDYDGVHYYRSTGDDGEPSLVPVKAFATRKAANEYARQLDADIRSTFPIPLLAEEDRQADTKPFAVALVAKLKELGIPPIKFGKDEYEHPKQFREWWAKHAKDMSAAQKAALWEPFEGMTFHRVQAVELED